MTEARKTAVPTRQLENERVIVTRWDFDIGAETGWHTHEYDYVVVPVHTGNLKIESPDGDFIAELQQGVSYTRNVGVHHNVINDNDFAFSFVEIELK